MGAALIDSRDVQRLHGVEGGRELSFLAVVARALPEARAAHAGRAMAPDPTAVLVLAHDVVEHDVLRDDDVAFHPHDFGDVSDPARAVAEALRLDDDVDR